MYSEQLAVLLFIAATHMAGPGLATQPVAQVPCDGADRIGLNIKRNTRHKFVDSRRMIIKRERAAMMLAEFR